MPISREEQRTIILMLYPYELVFVLVQAGRRRYRLIVKRGRRNEDQTIFKSRPDLKGKILEDLDESLRTLHQKFSRDIENPKSWSARAMKSKPALETKDLLTVDIIERIIADLKRENVADTYTYA